MRLIIDYIDRTQLFPTNLVGTKMANFERKLMLVGYRQLLSFSLFCLSLFEYLNQILFVERNTGALQPEYPSY